MVRVGITDSQPNTARLLADPLKGAPNGRQTRRGEIRPAGAHDVLAGGAGAVIGAKVPHRLAVSHGEAID
jgi:hypothetical protein